MFYVGGNMDISVPIQFLCRLHRTCGGFELINYELITKMTIQNLQLEDYFSRLKEVLEVTGSLKLNDLEYCKLLTEQEVVNNLIKPDVSQQRELLVSFLKFGRDRHYTPMTHATIIDMIEDFEAHS